MYAIRSYYANEYCQAVTENTKLGIQCEITNNENGTEEKEFFAYKYLGKIAGNIHILETSDYGSGTGIFMSLMLVKFNTDKGFYDDGTRITSYNVCYTKLLRFFINHGRDQCLFFWPGHVIGNLAGGEEP